MVVYEVTVTVDEKLIADYERYMTEQHIPDVLATGYFYFAEMTRSGNRYRVSYYTKRREMLDAYLASDTERLRADFAEHFPTGVEVTREIWDVIAESDGV